MSVARYFNPKLRGRLLSGECIGWLNRHPRKRYIVACILSAPPWVEGEHRAAINAMREEARALSIATGIPHVLDHIIPVNNPWVCGLSVPWNMQILTRKQNAAKSNHWFPNQLAFSFCDTDHLIPDNPVS